MLSSNDPGIEIEYLSFAKYYPRKNDTRAMRSKKICDAIKGGKKAAINFLLEQFNIKPEIIQEFINEDVTLVPVVRSHLMVNDALWPSLEICKAIVEAGFAKDISILLKRNKAVRSSSRQPSENRVTVAEHKESIDVLNIILPHKNILLVDDVVTQGRTMMACYQKIKETHPDSNIKCCAMLQTESFADVPDQVEGANTGVIIYNPLTGNTTRD